MDRMNNHKTSLNWKWIHILTSTSWFQNGPNTPPAKFSPVTILLEVAWFSSEIFTLRLRKDSAGRGGAGGLIRGRQGLNQPRGLGFYLQQFFSV